MRIVKTSVGRKQESAAARPEDAWPPPPPPADKHNISINDAVHAPFLTCASSLAAGPSRATMIPANRAVGEGFRPRAATSLRTAPSTPTSARDSAPGLPACRRRMSSAREGAGLATTASPPLAGGACTVMAGSVTALTHNNNSFVCTHVESVHSFYCVSSIFPTRLHPVPAPASPRWCVACMVRERPAPPAGLGRACEACAGGGRVARQGPHRTHHPHKPPARPERKYRSPGRSPRLGPPQPPCLRRPCRPPPWP
jgi:hypothetical protein